MHTLESRSRTPRNLFRALFVLAAATVAFAFGCGDDAAPAEESAMRAPAAPAVADPEPTPAPAMPTATRAPEAPPRSTLLADEPPQPATREVPFVDGLVVRRVAVARAVSNREPVDPGTRFTAAAEPLFAHFELTNRAGTTARHPLVVFVGPDGEDRGLIELDVPAGAPRWRTWAYTRKLDQPGRYQAVVRDANDRVIARAAFEVLSETT